MQAKHLVHGQPEHNADDKVTQHVMDWIARETEMALSVGDIWVHDDPEEDNYKFSFATRNGEIAMGILSNLIETGTLKTQLEPLEPPEIVLG